MAPYNQVYERLVSGPDDAVGAFAYVLYKQHKIEFIKSVNSREQRNPTSAEMDVFHQQNCLDTQLKGYTERAQVLAQSFLNIGLEEHIAKFEQEVRRDMLYTRFQAVESKLDERRGFGGWVANVTSNLVVNVMTIIVVGAIFIGYQKIADFNSGAESKVGIGDHAKENKAAPNVPAQQPSDVVK